MQRNHMVLYIALAVAYIAIPAISRPTILESAELEDESQDYSPTALPQSSARAPKAKKPSINHPAKSSKLK